MLKISSHYDNLQVSPRASTSVIRAAFKALSQKWHPDKHPDNLEEANQKFHAIKLAYDVLSNVSLREKYDKKIAQYNKRSTDRKREPSKLTKQYSTKQIKTSISFIV